MNWKVFFELSDKKVKTTITLVAFYYLVGYISGFSLNLFASKTIQNLGNTFIQSFMEQSSTSILELFLALVLSSIVNFVMLIILAYAAACVIASFDSKKRK